MRLTLKQVQELRERRVRCADAFQVFAEDLWEHREALLNAAEHLARTEWVDALERLGGQMQTRRAIEIVVMGVRGCSACDGTGLVEVSPEAPTGDCPRCREPGYKYRASGLDPDSQAEVNEAIKCLDTDARALWAVRVLDAWAGYLEQELALSPPTLAHSDWRAWVSARRFSGDSPDAARLAAADALWPELPADVRAEIGERP